MAPFIDGYNIDPPLTFPRARLHIGHSHQLEATLVPTILAHLFPEVKLDEKIVRLKPAQEFCMMPPDKRVEDENMLLLYEASVCSAVDVISARQSGALIGHFRLEVEGSSYNGNKPQQGAVVGKSARKTTFLMRIFLPDEGFYQTHMMLEERLLTGWEPSLNDAKWHHAYGWNNHHQRTVEALPWSNPLKQKRRVA